MAGTRQELNLIWLRNDLRLHDHPALYEGSEGGEPIELVYIIDSRNSQPTSWGHPRAGRRRQMWLLSNVMQLRLQLEKYGHKLHLAIGLPVEIISERLKRGGVRRLLFHDEPGHEEQKDATALSILSAELGIECRISFGGDLFPFQAVSQFFNHKGQAFTPFRQKLESSRCSPAKPLPIPDLSRNKAASQTPAPTGHEPMPRGYQSDKLSGQENKRIASAPENEDFALNDLLADAYSQFNSLASDPRNDYIPESGEPAALNRLSDYLFRNMSVKTYKETRNGMLGSNFSTRFSPWLAIGALSPRLIWAECDRFEESYGPNEGSEWLKFELLWREYFRHLMRIWGAKMFTPGGIKGVEPLQGGHSVKALEKWRSATTGQRFVDAHMNELLATGWMSNRGRQVVSSYLVHELECDWRSGAAWFEHQLIDYDVSSNYGNWLYLAGVGTDPRSGRVFNPDRQAGLYDAGGDYTRKWNP